MTDQTFTVTGGTLRLSLDDRRDPASIPPQQQSRTERSAVSLPDRAHDRIDRAYRMTGRSRSELIHACVARLGPYAYDVPAPKRGSAKRVSTLYSTPAELATVDAAVARCRTTRSHLVAFAVMSHLGAVVAATRAEPDPYR